jgi:hypothetical protein
VLDRLVVNHYLTAAQANAAYAEPLGLRWRLSSSKSKSKSKPRLSSALGSPGKIRS